jgi:N-acetylglucosamine-6-phosphate deacetylase
VTKVLTNGRIFTGDEILTGYDLVVVDGCIGEVKPAGARLDNEIDLDGGLLAPGFIDCQVNGGGGVLFNEQTDAAAIARMITAHRAFGTTGLLPTLISDDWATMAAARDAVQGARRQGLPGLLGLHFEGPYLNPEKKGAHDSSRIRPLEQRFLSLV